MRAATVCSGLGCPEAAMPEWDWVLASEIEAAPRAVMAYRHGAEDARYSRHRTGPALWGDFTTIRVRHFRRLGIPLPEWIVGGLPCQAFSIAGLRQSLDDARGNLTLEFLHLVHSLRRAGSLKGILFENVPGILSTTDNAFGCFLAGLVGADDALRSPFERGRWPDEGMVEGPRARAAWRIRDAQYDGLAQRRERVFVVASFVEGIDPAAILFERLGLHGNPPPRREKGEGTAGTLSARTEGGGGLGTDFDLAGGLQPVHAFGGGNRSGPIEQAACLTAKGQRVDFEVETFVTHALRGEGFDASEDGTGRGTPIVQGFDDGFTAIPYRKRKIAADEVEQSTIGGASAWQDETGQWFTDCMADASRYKMIGNSMARPVIRWILQRVVSVPEQERAVG